MCALAIFSTTLCTIYLLFIMVKVIVKHKIKRFKVVYNKVIEGIL